jgi:uncharacterized OsmC-like protein
MLSNADNESELAMMQPNLDMAARQLPLRDRYRFDPAAAWITDRAETCSERISPARPLCGEVTVQDGCPTDLVFGVHAAVGGESDYPVPGELLCAAIASCLDSTIRIIANRLHIELLMLQVVVEAHVDVRGTLLVDRKVPVGFQRIDVVVRIDPVGSVKPRKIDILLKAAEHSCVVMQTLRNGTDMSLRRA